MRWHGISNRIGTRFSLASALLGVLCVAGTMQAQTPNLPTRLLCTYDAVGRDPSYTAVIAFDQKTGRLYTSRGGKIVSGTVTDDEVTIMHTVTPADGEREVTKTVIDRHSGKIVVTRDGGGVLETGICVKAAD
jgi:hypothetical protein